MAGLHDGHRERLRKKLRKDALEDHEFLELMLGYSIKRQNTNDTAHRLLNRFGSLNGVLTAEEEALCQVEGVGQSTAFFIKMLAETVARYRRTQYPESDLLRSQEAMSNL